MSRVDTQAKCDAQIHLAEENYSSAPKEAVPFCLTPFANPGTFAAKLDQCVVQHQADSIQD